MFLIRIAAAAYLAMRCIYSLRQSYILILPKLFYLQTSVKSQRSYIGRQASCFVMGRSCKYVGFTKLTSQ